MCTPHNLKHKYVSFNESIQANVYRSSALFPQRLIVKINEMITSLEAKHNDINEVYSSGAVEGYSAECLPLQQDLLESQYSTNAQLEHVGFRHYSSNLCEATLHQLLVCFSGHTKSPFLWTCLLAVLRQEETLRNHYKDSMKVSIPQFLLGPIGDT